MAKLGWAVPAAPSDGGASADVALHHQLDVLDALFRLFQAFLRFVVLGAEAALDLRHQMRLLAAGVRLRQLPARRQRPLRAQLLHLALGGLQLVDQRVHRHRQPLRVGDALLQLRLAFLDLLKLAPAFAERLERDGAVGEKPGVVEGREVVALRQPLRLQRVRHLLPRRRGRHRRGPGRRHRAAGNVGVEHAAAQRPHHAAAEQPRRPVGGARGQGGEPAAGGAGHVHAGLHRRVGLRSVVTLHHLEE